MCEQLNKLRSWFVHARLCARCKRGLIRLIPLAAIMLSAIVVSPSVLAQSATLVRTTDTSVWNPASPDPAGITYIDSLNALLLSDSEVNETPLFTGDNLFQLSLNGVLQQTLTTIGFTNEPTGMTYNPFNHHLFISIDNSPRRVYELDPGPDGLYDTADDILTSFSTVAFGSNDAEGIAFNITQGTLHIVDGINSEVYTVHAGPNGLFDGVAPDGDDTVTQFDTDSLGIRDPEGIAYDSEFGHLYIVGKPRNTVAHVSVSGNLLRSIDISSASPQKPAGLVYAPASNGLPLNNSLYIVDRGVDNNSDPNENDGRLFEMSLPAFAGNSPPAVTVDIPNDGASFVIGQTVTFAATASDPEDGDISFGVNWSSSLDGELGQGATLGTSSLSDGTHVITATVSDSGGLTANNAIQVIVTLTPNAAPSVSISSPLSGEIYESTDGISFTASATDAEDGDLTSAVEWSSDLDGQIGIGALVTTLSAGFHTINATVIDSGALIGSDVVTVTVNTPRDGNTIVEYSIDSSDSDAEERSSGSVSLTSSDLELVFDGLKEQVVAMRFSNVFIPQDAGIVNAYIQFTVDEVSSGVTELSIQSQAADDAHVFVGSTYNISNRPNSISAINWSPAPWTTAGQAGADQRTPALSLPLQEVISRPGWSPGNAIAFMVRGTGERTAESFNGVSSSAPRLHVEYTTLNLPPVIVAGADQTISVADTINLQGSSVDDGLPVSPGTVATFWHQLIGPGTATFGDPSVPTTTVSFDEVGSYQLSMTGDDGELQGIDVVMITVTASAGNTAPVVDAGADINLLVNSVANLAGGGSDDGLPNPPGSLVSNWSQVSGPGVVSFDDDTVSTTGATFSLPGVYVLEFTADDGELEVSDQLVATVLNTDGSGMLDIAISARSDDAEERPGRNASLNSSDLELVFDKDDQTVGLRFNGVSIPPNATVNNAYIQFQVDEVSTGPTTLNIEGEDVDNAPTFVNNTANISVRSRTGALVNWVPPPWNTVGQAGPDQRTSQIASVIQEIVNRPGWVSGNSVAIIISGTGERVAESYNGSVSGAPLLHVEYQSGP